MLVYQILSVLHVLILNKSCWLPRVLNQVSITNSALAHLTLQYMILVKRMVIVIFGTKQLENEVAQKYNRVSCHLLKINVMIVSKISIFYSDNCIPKNKNRFYLSVLWYCLQMYPINTIRHRYLEKGHTVAKGAYTFS